MEEIFGISLQWLILIGINILLIFLLIIMTLSNRAKIKRLKHKYYKLMNGLNGVNMEAVIEDCLEKVNGVIEKNKEIEFEINSIQRNLYYCIQKVGVIRYNAFDNVGSDLSFSIALLDNNDDGLVISSLYSRDSSSTYAKPVLSGKSRYALSAEEIKAIDVAKKKSTTNIYKDKD